MAIVDLTNMDQFYFTTNTWQYDPATAGRSTTQWTWLNTSFAAFRPTFGGTGFHFTGSNVPDAGIVTSLAIDLDQDDLSNPEVRITGLSFDLSALAPLVNGSLTPEAQRDLALRTIYGGNDEFRLGNHPTITMDLEGDGYAVEAGQGLRGGNDSMSGTIATGFICGDYNTIAASSWALGGNDVMSITSSSNQSANIFGDAQTVNGTLLGGNDTITTVGRASVTGDAQTGTGSIGGGNDTIVSNAEQVSGDTLVFAGFIQGGDDIITGGDPSGYFQQLYGDAVQISGQARGGNDIIHGGGGTDYIHGDWGSIFTGGIGLGGNDMLYGDAGNDFLYGDSGNDMLRGDAGADALDGGDGFDTATWQYGMGANINVAMGTATDGEGSTDTFSNIEQYIGSGAYRDVFTAANGVQYFSGLGGNDYVVDNGTGGGDVFNGGDGFDTIAFYNRNAATVNLANGTAIVDGLSNSIIAFEEVYGSNTGGDTIVGDDGANTFWGFGGSDVLVGGKGLDTLNGGLGNDIFGFNASDLQSGVWDAISDFHEVASTDRDILYFNGVAASSLVVGEANGGVYVSTTALGGNGGVFIANFTAAQLSDQLMFT